MHRLTLLLLLLPAACGVDGNVIGMAANVAAVPVFGRTLPDLAVSAVTGRDCSMVHVEQYRPWCTPAVASPPPAPFCTRSLGTVDCWESAAAQPLPARPGVADGPVAGPAIRPMKPSIAPAAGGPGG
jgi:hypothetical protein